MTGIRAQLATEIRNRADRTREMAGHYEKLAAEDRDLATTLEQVAQRVERGEADDKFADSLAAARLPIARWSPTNLESEAVRLRRTFNIETLASAIAKLP